MRKIAASDSGQMLMEMRVRFKGRMLTFVVRPGTIDSDIVEMIVRDDSEYRLPENIRPRTIFDVGANIGAAAIYYSVMYPQAEIFCFEPLPENLELLRINTERNAPGIRIFPYGLSDQSGAFEYYRSDDKQNFGGGGFIRDGQEGVDATSALTLPLRTVREAMIDGRVSAVDVFKIDVEGSEYRVLQSIPTDVRGRAQAFIGELHGVADWEVCALLSRTHRLRLEKRIDFHCFPFLAVRPDLVSGTDAR